MSPCCTPSHVAAAAACRITRVAGDWVEIVPSADLAAARAMGRALAAPLRALGIKYFDASPWQLHHYVALVSAAL